MALLKPKWLFDSNEFNNSKNRKVHVHTISVSDVDDPDIVIAEPIYQWQQTEKGKWVMEHSNPVPSYHQHIDPHGYGYNYYIVAYLSDKDYTYYRLKYE